MRQTTAVRPAALPGVSRALATGRAAAASPGLRRLATILVNLAGAADAALFVRSSLLWYLHTGSLIGIGFLAEQVWFVGVFLVRRPPRQVSRHAVPWLLAYGGTFGGLLLRPSAVHPQFGIPAGLVLQAAGLAIGVGSLLALGRSFGLVAADRGLVTRGPYAIVRHPVYAAYVLIQAGYLLQAFSVRNLLVVVFANACNIGRALAEERVLGTSPGYREYQRRVRWRLLPGLW